MEIKKSWHRLLLQNKELLSKWLAKIKRTNTPVNEHSRLRGDHFEADCFKKIPCSSSVNLKPGSIPTKFCFVQEKTPRKLPAERKSVDRKQPRLNVNNPSDDLAECEIDNLELEIEESEEERLRRRIKELELSLERETARRKSVGPSAVFFHKAVLGGNFNSSRMAAALPPSIASFRRFLSMFSPLSGSMRSLSRPPSI